jgi:hypothetical protein
MGVLAKIFGGDIAGGIAKLIGQFHLDPAKQAEMQKAVMDNAQEVERWAHELEVKAMDNEIRAVETVNQTMREEAKSEHFLQWAWRPIVGFTMSAVMVNNYILLPYFRKFGLLPIEIPGEVWNVMLVVLGIAAGTRGYQKIVEAKK